jgi:hypothetical protein
MAYDGHGRFARPPEVPWDEFFAPMSLAEATARFNFRTNPRAEYISDKVSDWYLFCQMENHIYEYPTRDYIAKLSNYLKNRCAEISERTDEPTRILEVAAGQGRLGFLLAKALGALGVEHSLTMVDNFSDAPAPLFPSVAERLDYREAIARDRPHIILAAWVFGGADRWAPAFRAAPDTQEYIVIEQDGAALEDPRAAVEGFEGRELPGFKGLQLCYLSTEYRMHPSSTFSFSRVDQPTV